jgi:hypothetical protein
MERGKGRRSFTIAADMLLLPIATQEAAMQKQSGPRLPNQTNVGSRHSVERLSTRSCDHRSKVGRLAELGARSARGRSTQE